MAQLRVSVLQKSSLNTLNDYVFISDPSSTRDSRDIADQIELDEIGDISIFESNHKTHLD